MARYDAPSRRSGGQKQNTFFGGAAILAAGILVVKLIGMFYKIPLVNIIGDQGSTDFTNAYNIYSVLLTISTAGLPVAVSKLVSEADARGRLNQVHKTFRLALIIFLTLGALSFLVMYFRADWLAATMNDTKAAPGIKAMAPAVVCVGCLSALRGYSQGHMNMTPTSVSQIIEALCKLVIGLSLAYAMTKAGQPPEIAAAGAITGVTVGTMVALAYMIFSFLVARSREPRLARDVPDSAGEIIRDILRIAIPVTLGSSMVGIVTVVDAGLVQGQLQRVLLALALEPVPHILILDEPLSGVDIEGEHQLLDMLDELRTQYDLSIFLSTHDFATLSQFADKVILLNRRVLKSGPPEEVLSSPEFYETFHLRMGKGGAD